MVESTASQAPYSNIATYTAKMLFARIQPEFS